MKLRDYQREAVDACYQHWSNGTIQNPLIVAPTGAGKSAILGTMAAEVTQDPDSRVIVLTHRSELIEQDAKAIRTFTNEPIGIYSAQLKRKDMKQRIVVAGINSVYKKATRFDPFDVVIIDECHLLSRNADSMYGRFLQEARLCNPRMKLVGLTATHYRLDSGMLHEGKGALFDGIAYEIGVKMLLERGYLAPLVSKSGAGEIDLSNVHRRGGEYIPSELAQAADNDLLTQMACDEMVQVGANRKSWIVFCSSVAHCEHVRDALRARGVTCEAVTGDLLPDERKSSYARFDSQELRCITSCQVLTTGFDQPKVDLIALLTATESTGLYIQMVGRGTRIHPTKTNCLLLDYGGNVVRHGCFDDVRPKFKRASGEEGTAPAKECPKCAEIVHAGVRTCPSCGHEFPPPEIVHSPIAYDGAVLTAQVKPQELEVTGVRYVRHKKIGKPDSVRIDYQCGMLSVFSEWLCPEHEGFARRKFEGRCLSEWGIRPLANVGEVLEVSKTLPQPRAIVVRQVPGSKNYDIVSRYYD